MSNLTPQQHIDNLEDVLEDLMKDNKNKRHQIASVRYAISLIKQQIIDTNAYYVCHYRTGCDPYNDVYEVSKDDFNRLYPFKDSFESTYGKIPPDIKELASDCCDCTLDLTQAQIDLIPDDHWILVTDY